MKNYPAPLTSLIAFAVLFQCCKKEKTTANGCFDNDTTTRQITNKPAIVKLSGEEFYILEPNTIDSRLKPCNLAPEFKVDNLQVTVSGNVKATITGASIPCCTENFVITSITKQVFKITFSITCYKVLATV